MEIFRDVEQLDAITRAGFARSGSPYLNTAQAAHYCNLSERTMKQMRYDEIGPKYHKMGKIVRYHIDDLDAWLSTHRSQR